MVVAERKIGSPDAPLKNDVPHDRARRCGLVEHHDDVPGRVAGHQHHVSLQLADAKGLALFQPAVNLDLFRNRKAEHHGRLLQRIVHGHVVLVHEDGHAQRVHHSG